MAREFRTKVIDIKFKVVSIAFCFRTFPCKMKFHGSRDHFMKIRDSNFKKIFIKLGLKFVSKRSIQLGFFEFLKQVGWTFKVESANVSKN